MAAETARVAIHTCVSERIVSQASQEPWTIGRLLSWTTKYLGDHGAESPRLDAEVLLAHALDCARIELYTRFAETVSDAVRAAYRELLRRRAAHEPVAYLVGHKEFFSLDFEVGPDVLIPRPDSEFVILEFVRLARDRPAVTVVDVGAGSGNLSVAAARQHAGARVIAIDLSAAALAIARRNAERHGVADRIEFLEGDLLSPLPTDSQADFLISNPPYIPTEELDRLPEGVRRYEPRWAIDGGPGGLDVVGRLIHGAAEHLKPDGQFILEIGAPQESAVRQRMEATGAFELRPTIRDYAGHPRVVSATRRAENGRAERMAGD
jgi:release factor glutamine methyltransferase